MNILTIYQQLQFFAGQTEEIIFIRSIIIQSTITYLKET